MNKTPEWYYNEFAQAGVDYSHSEIIQNYDKEHTKFRNYEKEALQVIKDLELAKDSHILDMGCGSGGLTIEYAKYFKKVYAVDVSPGMIELCKKKAEKNNLANIEAECAGFITYNHSGEKLDGVISTIALHHLPDFWKLIALKRINTMLKPDGKFYLLDVVFSFHVENHIEAVDSWLLNMGKIAGIKMKEEAVIHIRDEYSTWDWIMSGMLKAAGFDVQSRDSSIPNTKIYLCRKRS